MGDLLDYTPIAAAAFAIPQFLPQLRKLRATDDTAGVSWSWATLTSLNNAAWFAYFAVSGYWTALVPAASATLLAGTLATMLARHGQAKAAAGGPDRQLGRTAARRLHRGRPHRPGHAAHGGLRPPGHAVDLDRLPNRPSHRRRSWNLAAHPG
jgi:hypothetical protein